MFENDELVADLMKAIRKDGRGFQDTDQYIIGYLTGMLSTMSDQIPEVKQYITNRVEFLGRR